MRVRIILLFLLLLIGTSFPAWAQEGDQGDEPEPTPEPPPPLFELNEANIKQATVYLMMVRDTRYGAVITCVGSGTLVRADGLILTNAHKVVSGETCQSDRIVVALTLRVDEPPVPTYVAELLASSPGLDLAVLRISHFIDGRLVDSSRLRLPFVELGDSDQVNLDDTILFVGYPDIGASPVQAILGTVSGLTAEARVGNRAWLRTTAPIPGVMSGGGAYDRNGRLIGIPTIAPARVLGEALDCRSVQDSDGNGQVDDEDQCIPVGGFISALRPIGLARGLVRAAALGIRLGEDFAPAVFPPPRDPPEFRRLLVSTGVNAAGMPVNVVSVVPSGATSLYLFFDYANMIDGMVYELQTTINGQPSPTFSLPPVTWNGGPNGVWYIGSSAVPWPNGLYVFTLFVEGRQVASHSISVGGGPTIEPAFSDVSFGLEDFQQNALGTNYVLPETNIVRAKFNYRNMRPDISWTQVWYLEENELARTTLDWAGGEQGVSQEAAIQSEVGLLSGRYRLELYVGASLSATADFVIAGGAEGGQAAIFSNFRFAGGQIAGVPQPPISDTFVTGLPGMYIFFDWRQLSLTTPWTWRWKVDGETLFQADTVWAAAPTGEAYYIALAGEPNLPDGTYEFQIEMGGIVLETLEARVGLGQLPLDVFASAEGVQLSGTILDAETGEGVAGAMLILLLPEFSVEDFTWEESQIFGTVLADEDGYFLMASLLPRGTMEEPILYSLLVRAEGYLPLQVDGIAVSEDTQSPLELNMKLNRDR